MTEAPTGAIAPTAGVRAKAVAAAGETLTDAQVRAAVAQGLAGRFAGERVLVLVPDHTRTAPLPFLVRLLVEALADCAAVDVMVALGTHPPLAPDALDRLVGVTEPDRRGRFGSVGLLNHAWDDPDALSRVGTLPADRVRAIAGDAWHPTLAGDVPVRINRAVLDHDRVVIVGPTFPHEVAGFSGGAKYLFPGVSGPEMIDVSHWLGALCGVVDTIGIADTPVRAMIHAAAELIDTPVELVGLVVEETAAAAGVFVGDPVDAWQEAAALSAERHITRVHRPFQRILSVAPPMYEELWTAGKAMYKLEPVLAEGGELIIYAPHLREVSRVHGEHIARVGYHVLPYLLANWDAVADVPRAVLAHSSHVRGAGAYRDGEELPRATVTLASRISREVCEGLGLGYADPSTIDPVDWQDRQDEGVLVVPKAGERLYRLADPAG